MHLGTCITIEGNVAADKRLAALRRSVKAHGFTSWFLGPSMPLFFSTSTVMDTMEYTEQKMMMRMQAVADHAWLVSQGRTVYPGSVV